MSETVLTNSLFGNKVKFPKPQFRRVLGSKWGYGKLALFGSQNGVS